MEKTEVLHIIEFLKDKPFEIGMADEGATAYGNIDGHWIFIANNSLVEVRKNTVDHSYGYGPMSSSISPFVIRYLDYVSITHIQSIISNEPGDISAAIANLTPAGTSKSLADITKEIESDSIRKVQSPSGNIMTDDTLPGSSYGSFKGSIISTSADGINPILEKHLLGDNQ